MAPNKQEMKNTMLYEEIRRIMLLNDDNAQGCLEINRLLLNTFGALEGEDPDVIINSLLERIERQTPTKLFSDGFFYRAFDSPKFETLTKEQNVIMLGDAGVFTEYAEQAVDQSADIYENTNRIISIPLIFNTNNKTFTLTSGILAKDFHYITFIINKQEDHYEVDIYDDDECEGFTIPLETEIFEVKMNQRTSEFYFYRTFYEVKEEKEEITDEEKAMFEQISTITDGKPLSNNFIDVLTLEQTQFVLEHIKHYEDQTPELEHKLKKHIDKLNLPGEQEKLEALIEEPEKILAKKNRNNTTKFYALTRQRKLRSLELNKITTETLLKQQIATGIITKAKFEYDSIQFLKNGDTLITYTPQINSSAVTFDFTSEELNKVQGMDGLEDYMKYAILVFSFDQKNKTEFFKQNMKQVMKDYPKQKGEPFPLTMTQLLKDVKDWWNNNTIEVQENGTSTVKPKARATIIQEQVDVSFTVYSTGYYESQDSEYKVKFSINYEIFMKGTEEKIEEGSFETNKQLAAIDEATNMIREHILDHAISADQNTEIEFRYKYPEMNTPAIFEHIALVRWRREGKAMITLKCGEREIRCAIQDGITEENIEEFVEENTYRLKIPKNIQTKLYRIGK